MLDGIRSYPLMGKAISLPHKDYLLLTLDYSDFNQRNGARSDELIEGLLPVIVIIGSRVAVREAGQGRCLWGRKQEMADNCMAGGSGREDTCGTGRSGNTIHR